MTPEQAPKEVWIDEAFHEYSFDTDQILASTEEGHGYTIKYLRSDIAQAQTNKKVREVLLEVRSRIRPKMEDHPLLREDILVHTIDNILKDYQ